MSLLYGEGEERAVRRLRRMTETADLIPIDLVLLQRLSWLRQWLQVANPASDPGWNLSGLNKEACRWLLGHEQYITWQTTPASTLWIYGKPDVGKSSYCTAILEDLLQRCGHSFGGVSAHYYFNECDLKCDPLRSVKVRLHSIIGQLSQHCTQVSSSLEYFFKICDTGQQGLSISTALDVLQQMIPDYPQVFTVIYGLDEDYDEDCDQSATLELMRVLTIVVHWQLPGPHLLMTSRDEETIRNPSETVLNRGDILCLDDYEDSTRVLRGIRYGNIWFKC